MIRVDWSKRQNAATRAADMEREAAVRARAYLAETDWYVTRAAETGKPIPDDIKAARKVARETASRSE
jgi:hypothetical protein